MSGHRPPHNQSGQPQRGDSSGSPNPAHPGQPDPRRSSPPPYGPPSGNPYNPSSGRPYGPPSGNPAGQQLRPSTVPYHNPGGPQSQSPYGHPSGNPEGRPSQAPYGPPSRSPYAQGPQSQSPYGPPSYQPSRHSVPPKLTPSGSGKFSKTVARLMGMGHTSSQPASQSPFAPTSQKAFKYTRGTLSKKFHKSEVHYREHGFFKVLGGFLTVVFLIAFSIVAAMTFVHWIGFENGVGQYVFDLVHKITA